jgi:ATP:ADP antiporter, AAA family
MITTNRFPIKQQELNRFLVLATLLFGNILVAQSSDVVATGAFITSMGADNILWLWAIDNLLLIAATVFFSLFADRIRREHLGVALLVIAGFIYSGLFGLNQLQAPEWLRYGLLLLMGDQAYLLFPMVLWTIANDMFSVAEAKRLFPLLGAVNILGSIFGNLLPALTNFFEINYNFIVIFNAFIMFASAAFLRFSIPQFKLNVRQSKQGDDIKEVFKQGIAFIRDVKSFFYLAIVMIFCGIAFNVSEYHLVAKILENNNSSDDFQVFYGILRAARTVILVVFQAGLTTLLVNYWGFQRIFMAMPISLLAGLVLSIGVPNALGAVCGNGIVRIGLEGVDEPARRAFFGLIPDEWRGRVSALMEGYLYSTGSILSCLVIGILLLFGTQENAYLGFAIFSTLISVWFFWLFYHSYNKSMLSWRLKRRKRSSILDTLSKKLE